MYIIKKIGYALSVMLGVVIVVFFLFQTFGDPTQMLIGQTGDTATVNNIKKELALDKPLWQQFLFYLNDVSVISIYTKEQLAEKKITGFTLGVFTFKLPYLRKSYQLKKEVSQILSEVFPQTLLLAFTAMLFATVIGIALGVIAALYKDTWIDTSSVLASIVGISAPSFFLGIIIAYVFGFLLHHYTHLPLSGSLYEVDAFKGKQIALKNLILPAITLGIRPLAIITQLTRAAMLEVLQQDYIRTAYAKGLSKQTVIIKHALRNALNPVITAVSGWFAELLAGAFFIEYIFGWNGMGKITVEALEKLDLPVVMGSVLVTAFLFVTINILVDVLYKLVDPRVKT
jgi:peptide/nickel transport system permease protein